MTISHLGLGLYGRRPFESNATYFHEIHLSCKSHIRGCNIPGKTILLTAAVFSAGPYLLSTTWAQAEYATLELIVRFKEFKGHLGTHF